MIIAVIGNYDPPPQIYALAEGVGRELARRGITLVCGGLTGVMEAVCKGAKPEDGIIFGVRLGGLSIHAVADDGDRHSHRTQIRDYPAPLPGLIKASEAAIVPYE